MKHIEEIKDYWNLRANGFSSAVEEELQTDNEAAWQEVFKTYITKEHADVLDDGTGPGFFAVILARLGHNVSAIDYSDGMIEKAKERFSSLSLDVNALQMDAQNLQFEDNSFDAVVSRNVIWNLDDPEKAYSEIFRVLRPGGVMIIDDGNMYLHHHDEEYAKKREEYIREHKKPSTNDGGLHGKHNTDNVDFSIIDKIAQDLPMSYTRRPQWDFNTLVSLGFADISVKLRGGTLPTGFRLVARKGEVTPC